MNRFSTHRIYQLLPAIYRERDYESRELDALLAIIGAELDTLETDIGDLYESWFIETCPDWVVPYIGDLLGIRGIGAQNDAADQPAGYGLQESRAYVANTLAYRRRKGTAPVLEQLARDVTGWPARAVEFFECLALMQNLNHLRQNTTTLDLRATDRLPLLGTPFEQQVAYSVELRRIATGAGKYNTPNIGLFLWRLQSYPITRGTANCVAQSQDKLRGRCYTFTPLSQATLRRPVPLFNPPQPETEITQTAAEINLPVQLRTDLDFEGYSSEKPPFQIFINGRTQSIPSEEVLITKLSPSQQASDQQSQDWQLPANELEVIPSSITREPRTNSVVAVDPAAGRMVFLDQTPPTQVEVTYAYGFSADMGGGPYNRSNVIAQLPPETVPQASDPFFSPLYWEVDYARSGCFAPLADAVHTWNGTVQAWQGCYDLTFIPLAHVEVPKARIGQISLPPGELPEYRPGVVWGMEVIATPGTQQIVITPGLAVDDQGRSIRMDENRVITVNEITPALPTKQPLWVVISHWADTVAASYQLSVIPQTEADQYPAGSYLRLASFSLAADAANERRLEAIALPNDRDFQAGIVAGLTVVTPPDVLEAIIQPGIAVDGSGRGIQVNNKLPLDLRGYRDQFIWLAITVAEFPTAKDWQIHILLEEDAEDESRYPPDQYLRLAKLYVPPVNLTHLETTTSPLRPTFEPGIVEGLSVEAESGDRSILLTAGRALDGDGQSISLERDFRVRGVRRYRGATVTLTIARSDEIVGPDWELKILQENDLPDYPDNKYLRLASLNIDATGRLATAPQSLSSPFKPGVVADTLTVTYAKAGHIRVNQGKAIDRLGNLITLAQSCTLDLRRYPGRAFLLFISHQQGQGWKPLSAQNVDSPETIRPTWPHLGMVPELPAHWEKPEEKPPKTGVIVIQDNHTYEGDLHIVIPNSERLQLNVQLLAADNCRPHLRGNISLQGLVEPESRRSPEFEPGDCLIDGLLIEGRLTVLAGDLKHLVLRHCTLVPNTDYSLQVEAATNFQALKHPPDNGDDSDDDVTSEDDIPGGFLLLILAMLWLIVQLIKLAFDSRHLSAQQRLKELTQYLLTEFEKIWCAFREELYQCQRSTLADHDDDGEVCPLIDWLCGETNQDPGSGDNADLQLTVDRSILGTIYLAPSIPDLAIWDSIIDEGSGVSEITPPGAAVAILAQGTSLDIQRSTLLGTTYGRRLEASTSLFTGVVSVVDQQVGCMRFCYVPVGSQTPLRYRCQPDLALAELSSMPTAVTAFCINSAHHQLFLGTAGQGVRQLQVVSEPTGIEPTGIEPTETESTDSASTDAEPTGILQTDPEPTKPDPPVTWGPANLKDEFITALASYHRSDDQTICFAATMGGDLFRLAVNQTDWQPAQPPPIQTYITTLLAHSQPLTGTITSEGTTVTGYGTCFEAELRPGNTIAIWRSDGNRAWEERCTVVSIESPQSLTIEAAFEGGDLSSETSFQLSILLAGTAGEGVWRFAETGSDWTCIHDKSKAQHINQLVTDARGRIYAGTPAGIFHFRWSKQNQSWQAVPRGLAQRQITALVVDTGSRLLAGTTDGVIFRSIDRGHHWEAVWEEATHAAITALAVQTLTGEGEINGTTLVTSAAMASRLKCGSAITIGDQTRRLVQVPQESTAPGTLLLDAEFCPALSGTVSFTSQYLFAGTARGVLRSRNNGDTWEAITLGNTLQKITALAVDEEQFTIWAGGAIGNVFRSRTQGESWDPANQGLKDVAKISAILRELQPRFTTTNYGQPGYGQLSRYCPYGIWQGAEDGAEMGAFHLLKQPLREATLHTLLNEYLRFGLQAGIFYMT
jgi:hypothetical protein